MKKESLTQEIPEEPLHKKKGRKSSPKKSKHKHDYKDVIAKSDYKVFGKSRIRYAPYYKCSICGQLRSGKMFFNIPGDEELSVRISMDLEEVQKYFPGLEIVEIQE